VVFVKPVPVKTMVVPYGAPSAIEVGAAEVIAGPEMVKAGLKGALAALVFLTVTATAPAVAPDATVAEAVIVVPVLAVVAPKVALDEATTEYVLKPAPVSVTGVVEPTATGAVGAVAPVTRGATVLASPRPNAPAAEVYASSLRPAPLLYTVTGHRAVVAPVSVMLTVTEFAELTVVPVIAISLPQDVGAPVTVSVPKTPLPNATVAPYSKPAPVIVKTSLEAPAAMATADGLTSWMPFRTLRVPPDTEPPSGLVIVAVNAPVLAAPLEIGLVGVTLKTIEVALTVVTVAVRGVPLPLLANETVAPVWKPPPVIVTVFAVVPS
jgi:hypothetical protein